MKSDLLYLRRLILVLALFSLGSLGACTAGSTEQEDARSSGGEAAEAFLPYENTLAVSAGMRSFTLPMNNPGVVPAGLATHMEEEDLIAGVVVDGQARADPRWVLVKYHVVNDTTNEEPLHPRKMERIPVMVERWGAWVKRFPQTDVVFASRLLIEQEEHGRGEHNEVGAEYIPKGFQTVANMEDTRLERNHLVFGIANVKGDRTVAFSLELLEAHKEDLKHDFDGRHYLIRKIGEFGVAAFQLEEDQVDQTYRVVSETPFRLADERGEAHGTDSETSSRMGVRALPWPTAT